LKLVFLGTPPVAALCLRHLAATSHEILAVCTHPDRTMGRGLKTHPTAVKEAALELGLPVREVPDVREVAFETWLRDLGADLLVVVAFVILPDSILATARLGAINLHGSLLPRWRGAAPVQRAIEAGDPVSGLSVFRLDSGIDTGGVLLRRELAVGELETSGELLERLGRAGGPALEEAIAQLGQDPPPRGDRQDPSLATRAPKLTPEEGRLDWSLPARRLHDKIRAFHPAPGCWTELSLDGTEATRLKIWRTRPMDIAESPNPGRLVALPSGTVAVGCGDTALELLEVQPEGKPRRAASDWFHGVRSRGPVLR
jgi:methionyl-tRNA formyltransferase